MRPRKTQQKPPAYLPGSGWKNIVIILLSLACVLLLILQVFNLSLFYGDFDPNKFGNVGTWFAAIATTTAVSLSLRESYARVIRDRRDLHDRLTDVVVWLEIHDSSWMLVVRNNTNTTLEFWQFELSQSTQSVHICARMAGPITPGEVRISLSGIKEMPRADPRNFPQFRVTFIDSVDRVWEMSSDGKLVQQQGAADDFRSHQCDVDRT